MKIAFIGKGGSGKSTVSWLATLLLAENGRNVFAIDADHNMDLASLLQVPVDETTPTFHRAHDAFREVVGQKPENTWGDIVLDGRTAPKFTLTPRDPFTANLTLPVPGHTRITAAVVGLGSEDILFSGKCSHGHSAPLKFYLPFLDAGSDTDVVIDGVAGADMMNFGLFLGCDAVVVVVEPQLNSMRVLSQVATIADRIGLPLFAVVNKATGTSPALTEIEEKWGDRIVGHIPLDTGLMTYDTNSLLPKTRDAGMQLLRNISDRVAAANLDVVARIKEFELQRARSV